jgi:hypothetical protein
VKHPLAISAGEILTQRSLHLMMLPLYIYTNKLFLSRSKENTLASAIITIPLLQVLQYNIAMSLYSAKNLKWRAPSPLFVAHGRIYIMFGPQLERLYSPSQDTV